MGICNTCFHKRKRIKTLHENGEETDHLIENGKIGKNQAKFYQNNCGIHNAQDNDEEFSLNTIRHQRDSYDSLLVISYIHHTINKYIGLTIIELIKQYTPQTKILLIETGQTIELQSNIQHIFYSIIINRGATLTTNCWNSSLKIGGTLLLKCVSSIKLGTNSSINLNYIGYKGGHSLSINDMNNDFIDNIHDDESATDENSELDGEYAVFSGESYRGIGFSNNRNNNFGGGGAGSAFGSGGGAGYGTKGYRGQYDKQYNNKCCGKGGIVYGSSKLDILYLGSGGGAAYGGFNGGNGGGAIKIECKNLIMNTGSIICCNGGDGKNKYLSGSGSGGSIHIIIDNGNDLKMNKNTRIEAIGGCKKALYGYGFKTDNLNNCGKGGNGRICIETNKNYDLLKKRFKNQYKYNIEPIPYII